MSSPPPPALSAGTRQCTCGGWTRIIVCQYCGATDPAYGAAGMVSVAPLTVPALDADPMAVPPANTAGLRPDPQAAASVEAVFEVSPNPVVGQTASNDPTRAQQRPGWLVPISVLVLGGAGLGAYVMFSGTSGDQGSARPEPSRQPTAVRTAPSAPSVPSTSSVPSSRAVVETQAATGSSLLTSKLPPNFVTIGAKVPVPLAVTSLTPDMLIGHASTGIQAAFAYVTRRGAVTIHITALQFSNPAAAVAFVSGPSRAGSPWAISNSRSGVYDWGNGVHSHAALVANGVTAFSLRADGASGTLYAMNTYAMALRS